jgi:hypothetical protein
MKKASKLLVELSIAVVALAAWQLIVPSKAIAAGTGLSITTSPVNEVLTSKPGTEVSTTLHVQNNNSLPLPMTIKMYTFGADGTSGRPLLTQATPADTFLNWAHFTPSTFVAQPDVPVAVTMTIDIPKTASLGYNYGVAFEPILSAADKGVSLNGSNVILVLLDTASSNEVRSVQVASFTASKKLYEYLPVTFDVNIHNNGNVFLSAGGDIFISKTANFLPGSIIDHIDVNTAQGNILPGTNRVFQEQWTDGFPVFQPKQIDGHDISKNNSIVYQLNWNFSQVDKLRFGKYYAKLELSYNNGKIPVPVTAVLSFWVLPWKLLLLALFVLLLIIGMIIVVFILIHRMRRLQRGSSRRRG